MGEQLPTNEVVACDGECKWARRGTPHGHTVDDTHSGYVDAPPGVYSLLPAADVVEVADGVWVRTTPCDKCKGSTTVGPNGSPGGPGCMTCPTCGGRGFLWPEGVTGHPFNPQDTWLMVPLGIKETP